MRHVSIFALFATSWLACADAPAPSPDVDLDDELDDVTTASESLGEEGAPVITEAPISIYSREQMRSSIVIRGTGFGERDAGSTVYARGTLASTDPQVEVWQDDLIIINRSKRASGGSVRVTTAGGYTRARLQTWQYDMYSTQKGASGSPLAIAAGADGRVWIWGEFNFQTFTMFDPASKTVTPFSIPASTTPVFIQTLSDPPAATQMTTLAESTLVDPTGRVWFAQGGGYLYTGPNNHSRIVSYDPAAPEASRFKIYNLPGDNNQVNGLAWDHVRNRIWYTSNNPAEYKGRVGSFDPETAPYDNTFNFASSINHHLCTPGGSDAGCFREYPVSTKVLLMGKMLVDHTGDVWYNSFWGSGSEAQGRAELGRLHPDTGAVERYPLSKPRLFLPKYWVVDGGAWEIRLNDAGDIVFNEWFDDQVVTLRAADIGNPECLAIDPLTLNNPCLEEFNVPDLDVMNQRIHSIDKDMAGNIWMSIADFIDYPESPPNWGGSLAYISPEGTFTHLPPLTAFNKNAQPNGITQDPNTGAIYFANYHAKQLGRLIRRR